MIDDAVRTPAQGKNFAALTTLLPDRQPRSERVILQIAPDRQIAR